MAGDIAAHDWPPCFSLFIKRERERERVISLSLSPSFSLVKWEKIIVTPPSWPHRLHLYAALPPSLSVIVAPPSLIFPSHHPLLFPLFCSQVCPLMEFSASSSSSLFLPLMSSLSPLSSSLSLMCMHVREFPQFFFHYDSFLTHKWIDAGPGEKTDRAQSDKVNLGNGYPTANYEDEKFFQCRQTTTVPHVVSEAPRVRRVELVRETSKSTPSQALGLGSSRGARRSTQRIGP